MLRVRKIRVVKIDLDSSYSCSDPEKIGEDGQQSSMTYFVWIWDDPPSLTLHSGLKLGGLCSCLDPERGTSTCLVLVLQRLISQRMPKIISIQLLSYESSPTLADIALTMQFSQVKCGHLEQFVLEASSLHSQQR